MVKVPISNECAYRILQALRTLDGYDIDGKRQYYKLSSLTRIMIAKLSIKMERQVKVWESVRDSELLRISNGKGSIDPKESPEQVLEFTKIARELNSHEEELSTTLFNIEDFNLDENITLPASTLTTLAPLINWP